MYRFVIGGTLTVPGTHEVWEVTWPDSHAENATYALTITVDGESDTYTYTNTPDAGDAEAVGKAMMEYFNRKCPQCMFIAFPTRTMVIATKLTTGDLVVASGGGDVTFTVVGSAALVAGARSTALQFDEAASGGIAIPSGATWQGTNLATGTASYFRLLQIVDADTAEDTTFIYPRIQGSISTSGADMNLTSISLVDDAPTIITEFSITVPAA